MADRTSAALFADIFENLAKKEITVELKTEALDWWAKISGYDFAPEQMDADEALLRLDLAYPCVDCTSTIYLGREDYHEKADCEDMQECLKNK